MNDCLAGCEPCEGYYRPYRKKEENEMRNRRREIERERIRKKEREEGETAKRVKTGIANRKGRGKCQADSEERGQSNIWIEMRPQESVSKKTHLTPNKIVNKQCVASRSVSRAFLSWGQGRAFSEKWVSLKGTKRAQWCPCAFSYRGGRRCSRWQACALSLGWPHAVCRGKFWQCSEACAFSPHAGGWASFEGLSFT